MIETVDDPILFLAVEFWVEARGDKFLPSRVEIDPLNIPARLFPYLILADVISSAGTVRYKLIGNEMHSRWGENFSGKTSTDLFSGTYRDYLEAAFALCISERLPVFTASRFRWDQEGFLWTRRVMLPISGADEEHAAQILIVQTWPNSNSIAPAESSTYAPGVPSEENLPARALRV